MKIVKPGRWKPVATGTAKITKCETRVQTLEKYSPAYRCRFVTKGYIILGNGETTLNRTKPDRLRVITSRYIVID